jgi:hypothetical protein
VNLARQAVLDDDEQERDLVVAEFRERLLRKNIDPDRAVVFVPTSIIHDWLQHATDERRSVTKVTPYLRTLAIAELRFASKRNGVPGWEWRGRQAPKNAKAVHIERTTASPRGSYKSRVGTVPRTGEG